MSTRKSHELFGEEYSGYDVTSFDVKDGKGFYISYTVDNTRTTFTQYLIRLEYSDGSSTMVTADSQQELELWTKYLI